MNIDAARLEDMANSLESCFMSDSGRRRKDTFSTITKGQNESMEVSVYGWGSWKTPDYDFGGPDMFSISPPGGPVPDDETFGAAMSILEEFESRHPHIWVSLIQARRKYFVFSLLPVQEEHGG